MQEKELAQMEEQRERILAAVRPVVAPPAAAIAPGERPRRRAMASLCFRERYCVSPAAYAQHAVERP